MRTRNKIIPDESITSSSYLRSDRAPSYARLDGPRAWCSAPGDNSPYIQILLEEEKLITAIETQGSRYDSIWSTRYDVWYLKRGNWTLHREVLEMHLTQSLRQIPSGPYGAPLWNNNNNNDNNNSNNNIIFLFSSWKKLLNFRGWQFFF